jgi:O-glycosyl hydrolase
MLLFITASGCSKKTVMPETDNHCYVNGVDTCNKAEVKIVVNLGDEKQTVSSFGASDCWTTKFVGKWANSTKKNQIADYLFSMDNDANGNPKGIGLSLWRFNIGAGSFEQGAASGIPDEYRREECFLNADGTYDWTKQAGQQWFLTAAKSRGVQNFLGFSVSPPVQYTVNNKAFGLANSQLNLKPDKQGAFADFLVAVAKHFQGTGTPFNFISPFNEPQWNWGEKPSQEGTGATNNDIAQFARILGPKIQSAGVSAKIVLGEANQWNSLDANNSDNRGDQINQFFNPASSNYIGNVPALANLLSAHSYFTTCPGSDLVNYRQNVVNKRNSIAPSLQLWQSEFGILGDICGQANGYPRNLSIDYGLYVAKVVHNDLTIANVSSWQWWLAVDTYNYSDGLVYINDPAGGYDLNAMKNDGIVSDSKQLWCLGNFSRFIRPGMIRVDAAISDITDPVVASGSQMVSAYKNPATKQFVIVIINTNGSEKKYTLDTNAIKLANKNIDVFTTSASRNLMKSTINTNKLTLEGRSVTTLTGTYQ